MHGLVARLCFFPVFAIDRGGWVKSLLRVVNAALGAALILLGVGLGFATFIDTGHSAATDSFRLIQIHCVLTGALSFVPVFWARRDILVVAPVLLLGGVNAWLGFLAATSGDPRLLWSLAFAASSAVCLGYLFATDVPAADETPPGAGPDDDAGLVAPDFGASHARSRGRAGLFSVGLIVIILAAMSAVIFFGGVYCELLRLALIERRAISLRAAFETLIGGAGADFLFRLVIALVATTVAYGLVFLVEAAVSSGAEKRLRDASADFDRDLSSSERLYLRDSLDALLRYLEGREFGRAWPALYAVGATALIAMMVAGPFAVAVAEGVAMDALAADRANGAGIIFYSNPFYVGGVSGGFFAGTLLIWALFQSAGARRPEFGEYLYARTGWNSLSNGPRSAEQYLTALARFVRAHRLDPGAPFEPAAFLVSGFREHAPLVHRAAAWSLLFTACAAFADVARFRLVDEDGVSYSNYLQFTTKRIAHADIDHIAVTCALLAPDDDGDSHLRVGYELVEQGVFRIDVLDRFERDASALGRLAELDARLMALSIPVVKTDFVGWADKRRAGFVDTCREEIAARYDPEIAIPLIRLLRVGGEGTPTP